MYANSEQICWQCGQEIITLEDEKVYIIKCGCGVRAFNINLYNPEEVKICK